MNRLLSILDWLFIVRPTLLFTYWTMLICGLGLHGNMADVSLITIVCICFGMAAANLLNLINDVESDQLNQKLPWISHGLITRQQAKLYMILLYTLCFTGLAFRAGMVTLISSIILFAVLGMLYNTGSKPFKSQPFLSLLILSVIGVGLWVIGVAAVGAIGSFNWIALTGYSSAWIAVCLISMVPDIKGDRLTNKITFSVKFGANITTRISALLIIIALLYSIYYRDIVLLVPSAISFPFFTAAAIRGNLKWIGLAVKSSILALSLMAAIVHALQYLILIVVYFFFARWYYMKRFSLVYPALK